MSLRYILSLSGVLAIIVTSVTVAQEPIPLAPGIFDGDDRHVVDSEVAPWPALGQINTTGYRHKIFCSGTLIAPRKVVTAAHCVLRRGSDTQTLPGTIHFVAGVRRNKRSGHSTAACVRRFRPSVMPRNRSHARFLADIAIVVLKQPIDIPPVPLFAGTGNLPANPPANTGNLPANPPANAGIPLVHAGYPRNRRFLPMVDDGCRLQRVADGVWYSDCDTDQGHSGGPIFVYADGALRLAAVSVGVRRFQHNISIPASLWRDFATRAECR